MEQTFKAVIMTNDDGAVQIAFFAEDGTPAQGAENIAKLLKAIAAQGVVLDGISAVEVHRAGGDEVLDRLHDATHQHSH